LEDVTEPESEEHSTGTMPISSGWALKIALGCGSACPVKFFTENKRSLPRGMCNLFNQGGLNRGSSARVIPLWGIVPGQPM